MFNELELCGLTLYSLSLESLEEIEQYTYLLQGTIQTANIKRKKEFIAGRLCALKALGELGLEDVRSLEVGEHRQPLWPLEITGSITHTKKMAVATASKKINSIAVGIDLEKIIDQSRFDRVSHLITTELDERTLEKIPLEYKQLAQTIIFSAKEALYKLLFPLVKSFFGFEQAYIKEINFKLNEFTIVLKSELDFLTPFCGDFKGHFVEVNGQVLTGLHLVNIKNI